MEGKNNVGSGALNGGAHFSFFPKKKLVTLDKVINSEMKKVRMNWIFRGNFGKFSKIMIF